MRDRQAARRARRKLGLWTSRRQTWQMVCRALQALLVSDINDVEAGMYVLRGVDRGRQSVRAIDENFCRPDRVGPRLVVYRRRDAGLAR